MSTINWDSIWNRARSDLVVTTEHGDSGLYLWDHSARVARCAERIAELPIARQSSPDSAAILAAALYHEAGWIDRLRDGEITRDDILLRPVSETHREQGALALERSVRKLLPAESLARASRAIRTLDDRKIESIEGQIVSEADNLEEFGVVALWTAIRRGAREGKGVQALLDMCQRRREYRFWEARLKDSFRFPPVRAIARARLEKFERVMGELREQHLGSDLSFNPPPPTGGDT